MARAKKVTTHRGKTIKPVRKLRHWKQQFNANAAFIWRKSVQWETTIYKPGQLVPKDLLPPVKVRRFWESGIIELAEFDDDVDVILGKKKSKPEKKLEPKKVKKGKWRVGDKFFKTKKAAQQYIDEGRK